jgi:hypothetical protein
MESFLGLWLGLIEIGLFSLIFGVMVASKWPGKKDECIDNDDCHCETIRPGRIKQPINTWSNLAFVLVGLLVLLHAGGAIEFAGEGKNPMTMTAFYPISYGLLVISLGLGSMFFHASVRKWGSIIDNLAMYWFLTFVVLYDLFRLFGTGNLGVFLLIFLFANIALGVARLLNEGSEKYVFPILFLWVIAIELLIPSGVFNVAGVHREFVPWLRAELIFFVVAFLFWILFRSRSRLCKPDSWFQGHAVWQILSAIAGGFLYLNLLAEV